jgi:hypothetical protein
MNYEDDTKKVLKGFDDEKERTGPPEGFPGFPVIPGKRYTDHEFQKLEFKYLWQKTWVYACHLDQIPDKGSYLVWDKLKVKIKLKLFITPADIEVPLLQKIKREKLTFLFVLTMVGVMTSMVI